MHTPAEMHALREELEQQAVAELRATLEAANITTEDLQFKLWTVGQEQKADAERLAELTKQVANLEAALQTSRGAAADAEGLATQFKAMAEEQATTAAETREKLEASQRDLKSTVQRVRASAERHGGRWPRMCVVYMLISA